MNMFIFIMCCIVIIMCIIFWLHSDCREYYTAWGPLTPEGKKFYAESSNMKLNDQIIKKIQGVSSSEIDPLEWIIPTDPRYKYYASSHNGQVPPSLPFAIALPDTNEQIIEVCKFAKSIGIPVSIRAGGHSYIGASSCDGIIISLEKMKRIEVNVAEKTAYVEAGTRLGELYYALFQQGPFNFPGGVCPTVGLAGFILGGGEGLLQRKFGLGCDSLLDAEIIVTDTDTGGFKIIKSVRDSDPLLMQALRGGGQSNFGIITKLKIQVYDMSKYYATFTLKFPLKDSSGKWSTEPWKKFQEISKTLTGDISCYYAFYMPKQPAPITFSMVQGQYTGNVPFDISFLHPLSTLPGVQIEIQTYTPEEYLKLPLFWSGVDTVEDMLKQCQAYGKDFPQENFRNLTDKYNLMTDDEIGYFMNTIQDYFEKLEPNYPGWVGIKWDLGGGKISSPNQPNVIVSGGHFATSQYMYYFVTGEGGGGGVSGAPDPTPLEEDPKTSLLATYQQEMYKKLTPVVSGFTYVNYPLNIIRNPLQYYYGEYLNFLITLKREYDPEGFWHQPQSHKLQSYPLKLWRDDGLCGSGLPSLENGSSICNPLSKTPVCDQDEKSKTYRKCIVSRKGGKYIDYSKRIINAE